MKAAVFSIVFLLASLNGWTVAANDERRPRLQIFNGSTQPADIFWLKTEADRVPNGSIAPGENTVITTTLGHRFVVVGREDKAEARVTSEQLVQALRFEP